jgi:pimeloyl-ACP methyl ester carboxylesterase
MALYAFDGTGKRDRPGSGIDRDDTNIVWLAQSYAGPTIYLEGVGTRLGLLGQIAGTTTGAGGLERTKRALEAFDQRAAAGDTVVHVVGYSRGAAIALHFVNQLGKRRLSDGSRPVVRFLGLFDAVPSFGVPGNEIDLGWDLDLPPWVRSCFHAMALDERRSNFDLHRPNVVAGEGGPATLVEVWFRGVHSDVGGGNNSRALSSIALNWMYAAASRAGAGFDPAVVARNAATMDPGGPVHENFDPIVTEARRLRTGDVLHASVTVRERAGKHAFNNPPPGLRRLDDDLNEVGLFRA